MLQPQSDEEIRPVVEALRRLDPLLDLRWEPRAFRTKTVYDALGVPRNPDAWEGRWEVIRWIPSQLHDRAYTRIMLVTEVRMDGKCPVMFSEGAYAAIGFWLVEYMALWDRAQNHYVKAMEQLWAEHDAAEAVVHDAAATQEGLEKVYREHGGGEYWMGRGYGEGTRTRTST